MRHIIRRLTRRHRTSPQRTSTDHLPTMTRSVGHGTARRIDLLAVEVHRQCHGAVIVTSSPGTVTLLDGESRHWILTSQGMN